MIVFVHFLLEDIYVRFGKTIIVCVCFDVMDFNESNRCITGKILS